MPNIDETWVREQFQAARVKVGVGNAVLKLLKTWGDIDLSDKALNETIEVFAKVALSHALVETPKNEVWVPAQPGFILVADVVRVMHDAYDGDLGRVHNGRVGKVVAVRHGDVVFKSTDGKLPDLDGTHYAPYKLEKRVQ